MEKESNISLGGTINIVGQIDKSSQPVVAKFGSTNEWNVKLYKFNQNS